MCENNSSISIFQSKPPIVFITIPTSKFLATVDHRYIYTLSWLEVFNQIHDTSISQDNKEVLMNLYWNFSIKHTLLFSIPNMFLKPLW